MANWSSPERLLRYYVLEGFLYVEGGCTECGHVQRTLVFPDAKVVECLKCGRMTSHIMREIEVHV